MAYFEQRVERIPYFSSPCPGSVWLVVSLHTLFARCIWTLTRFRHFFPLLSANVLVYVRELQAAVYEDDRMYG